MPDPNPTDESLPSPLSCYEPSILRLLHVDFLLRRVFIERVRRHQNTVFCLRRRTPTILSPPRTLAFITERTRTSLS